MPSRLPSGAGPVPPVVSATARSPHRGYPSNKPLAIRFRRRRTRSPTDARILQPPMCGSTASSTFISVQSSIAARCSAGLRPGSPPLGLCRKLEVWRRADLDLADPELPPLAWNRLRFRSRSNSCCYCRLPDPEASLSRCDLAQAGKSGVQIRFQIVKILKPDVETQRRSAGIPLRSGPVA